MDGAKKADYAQIAKEARLKTLDLIYKAQTSHIGSVMSSIDIMTVLFEHVDMKKDEVILSAGWKAAAWYYFLWRKGVITEEELTSFCMPNSKFIGLVEPMNRWGLKCAGGSMGIAFSMAVGMARAKKAKNEDEFVYVLMSDGEMQCGNVWESARKAVQEKLDNLIVILDRNGFQAMGEIKNILKIQTNDVFSGWGIIETDGHHFDKLNMALVHQGAFRKAEAPYVISAQTIKGKGVSFFEANNDWHYRVVDSETYELAKKELGV